MKNLMIEKLYSVISVMIQKIRFKPRETIGHFITQLETLKILAAAKFNPVYWNCFQILPFSMIIASYFLQTVKL